MWVSDCTAAGTFILADAVFGPDSINYSGGVRLGD